MTFLHACGRCCAFQTTARVLCTGSPLLYWFTALLTVQTDSDLLPIKKRDPKEDENDENSPNFRRNVWLKVERARNLETRHATVLLQEYGAAASDWTKIYFLGATLCGSCLSAAGVAWM